MYATAYHGDKSIFFNRATRTHLPDGFQEVSAAPGRDVSPFRHGRETVNLILRVLGRNVQAERRLKNRNNSTPTYQRQTSAWKRQLNLHPR